MATGFKSLLFVGCGELEIIALALQTVQNLCEVCYFDLEEGICFQEGTREDALLWGKAGDVLSLYLLFKDFQHSF